MFFFSCSKWQSLHQPVVTVEDLDVDAAVGVEGVVGVVGDVDEGNLRIKSGFQ